MDRYTIGINIGLATVKIVIRDRSTGVVVDDCRPHHGDIPGRVNEILASHPEAEGALAVVTGGDSRRLLNLPGIIESLAAERVLKELGSNPEGLVSLGGEEIILYTLNEKGIVSDSLSGSKCASGTGEFFRQQLARMDMDFEKAATLSPSAAPCSLSSRCSVFMKSDCTHKLNKNEANKEDIVLSLSKTMAERVVDFLARMNLDHGSVYLIGGAVSNPHLLPFLQSMKPEIDFIIPKEAPYFEAYGASFIAEEIGKPLKINQLIRNDFTGAFPRLDPLPGFVNAVTYLEDKREAPHPGAEYILGIDGGSTTTKVSLVNRRTRQIAFSHYGRTHGDPVAALKECLVRVAEEIRKTVGDENTITIRGASVTGSSREILGVFLETEGVYNEIIAHATGAAFFDKETDTIFEIGGQDAKYVFLHNGVPIDYAMNEACSAGTGSFLEESAAGDLNIERPEEIGPLALKAHSPLKFGEHCSAFINSDIRKAIGEGADRADVTAGIVHSIGSNYLNRVVGNRTVGKKIFLQGGVAKNPAVAPVFAALLGREIIVPPAPELMGCFGAALMALDREANEEFVPKEIRLKEISMRSIEYGEGIVCKSCENLCSIQRLNVAGSQYFFGGRCSKFTQIRVAKEMREGVNWVDKRNALFFTECIPSPSEFERKRDFTVGLPRCFSYHSLYPLYRWFFHTLGIEVIETDEIDAEGTGKTESEYCFPAEIAHGAVSALLKKKPDHILLPHFRDMPSYEKDVHANFCPITQSFPYYIKKAFPKVSAETFLPLVVSFKFGKGKALEPFVRLCARWGISKDETTKAFDAACDRFEDYLKRAAALGEEALDAIRKSNRTAVALLGRPYNAFTPEANMGIPRKFTSRGIDLVPYDILPFADEEIFSNMYWYYGQQNVKSSHLLSDEKNLFITYITNFSCAPDSFILHYIRWNMKGKPFLTLELDSHSADAGIDTRVEAFLDVVNGYRSLAEKEGIANYDNGLEFVNPRGGDIHLANKETGEKIPIRNNPKVKILLSNMGSIGAELAATLFKSGGFSCEALPKANDETLRYARAHTSGKECVPSHLVLGSTLQYLYSDKYKKDEIYLLFVPITTGPCRTGQYYVYYQNLFRDLRLENVVVFTLSADNSYNELGPDFAKNLWKVFVISDYLKDIECVLRACASDVSEAMRIFQERLRLMIFNLEERFDSYPEELARLSETLKKIPLKRNPETAPKVLVVGEIYVRRDDFAVDEVIERLSSKGIIAKTTGVSEWIHYLDFVRKYDLKKRWRLHSCLARFFSREQKKLLELYAERWWKHNVERQVRSALNETNLLVSFPDDMEKIMDNAAHNFIDLELNSEITVSTGSAATAMGEGYSGVINISPFACLIGRVIEGLYTPWAREEGFPVFSLEVDGNSLPPNLVNKLEIFMLNVLRFRRDISMDEILDKQDIHLSQ